METHAFAEGDRPFGARNATLSSSQIPAQRPLHRSLWRAAIPPRAGGPAAVGAVDDLGPLMLSVVFEIPRLFRRYFRIFRQLVGRHMYVLTALNVLMSYAEGIGIALFFPLLRGEGEPDALSASLTK